MKFVSKLRRRGLALLLALLMCTGMTPLSAFAAEPEEQSGYASEDDENTLWETVPEDEAPGDEDVPEAVQAFLDAVDELGEIMEDSPEDLAEYIYGSCAELYEALLGTEYEDREDVKAAASSMEEAIELLDAYTGVEFYANADESEDTTPCITVMVGGEETLTGQMGYEDEWSSDDENFVTVEPTKENASSARITGIKNSDNEPVTVTHTYKDFGGNKKTEKWHVYAAKQTTRVYVYVKIAGKTNGWTINDSNWITIGYIDVPRAVLSSAEEKQNGRGEEYNTDVNILPYLNVDALKRHANNADKDFNFSQVNWTGTNDGKQLGLHTSDGANDYRDAKGTQWHLDGLLTINDIDHNLKITYSYCQNDLCKLNADSSLLQGTKEYTLKEGSSYDEQSPEISGWVPSLKTVRGNLWTDTTVNVYYHQDANNNGVADCQERYEGTVSLDDWTYGETAPDAATTFERTTKPTENVTVDDNDDNDGKLYTCDYTYYKVDANGNEQELFEELVDAGSYKIKAVWKFNGVEVAEAEDSFTIHKRPITLTAASPTKVYDGTPLTGNDATEDKFTVSDGSDASGLLTGHAVDADRIKFDGTRTLPYAEGETRVENKIKEGTVVIKDRSGNDVTANYEITTKPGTLIVTDRGGENDPNKKYEVSVEANSLTATYDGTLKSVNGFDGQAKVTFSNGEMDVIPVTVASNLTFYVGGLVSEASGTNVSDSVPSIEITGNPVVYDAEGNIVTGQFIVKTTPGSLTIKKRSVTLTSQSLSKEYDGTPLTNDGKSLAIETGWAPGEGASYSFTGSQTVVGKSSNEFTYTLNEGTKEKNYVISKSAGQLEVIPREAKYEVNVTAKSVEVPYDGEEHSVSGFEEETPNGIRVTAINGVTYYVTGLTSKAKGTNVKDSQNTIPVEGTAVVKDKDGNDVSANFKVNARNGYLTINKAKVTLRSKDLFKEYDGKPLTNDDKFLAIEDGWADGEGAEYTFTGSQTLKGHSPNFFTYTLNDGTDSNNYDISKTEGQLTVNPRNKDKLLQVTVTANSLTEPYDGTEKSVSGFVGETDSGIPVQVDGITYYVSGLTSAASGKDVNDSQTEFAVSGTAVVKDAAGNDVTENFNVNVKKGSLIITQRSLTLKSADLQKVYDGTELVNGDMPLAVETGWAGGEGASYSFTGSRKLAGESPNTFIVTPFAGTDLANYEVVKSDGSLTVTDRISPTDPEADDNNKKFDITVTGNSASVVYDGKEHSVSGVTSTEVTVKGIPYTIEVVGNVAAAGTNAGEYPVEVQESDIIVRDADGNNVTGQFSIQFVPGVLSIRKRSVILSSESAEKTADGEPLTAPDITISGQGFINDDGVSFIVTGHQTTAGTSFNTFVYEPLDGTNLDNYQISTSFGFLTVIAPEYQRPSRPSGGSQNTSRTTGDTTDIRDSRTPLSSGEELTDIMDEDVPLAAMGLNTTDHYAYIAGYSDGTVRPLNNITRAEVATIFFRLMTDNYRTANWATSNSFPDVKADEWYTTAISTAAKASLISGDTEGRFRPDAPITRAEFATIAARMIGGEADTESRFTDTEGHWAKEYIDRAAGAGWIKGSGDKFRPDDPITRAEAVTIVNAMLGRSPDKEHMLDDMIVWPDNPESEWFYEAVQEATNTHDYEREDALTENWTRLGAPRDWNALSIQWADAAVQQQIAALPDGN